MDKNPKRNRDRYNPYYLTSDKKNNIYIVTISSGDMNKDIEVNITREVFELMNDLERNEARLIQQDKRHLTPSLYVTGDNEDNLTQEEKWK